MKLTAFTRSSLVLAASLLASACSRQLPSQWPTSSPASASAEELPAATVTLALDGDPPLPGEGDDGWIGLERPRSDSANGHHHHHNRGEAAPTSKGGHRDH